MYPVSADFLAALRAPHQMTVRVELWEGDTKRLTDSLAISDGSVTLDRTNQVFGTAEITAQLTRTRGLVVDQGTMIDFDAMNPYGLTLRPFRGIRFAVSTSTGPVALVEEVPLGRFLIEAITRDVGETAVKLQASGYRSFLRDDKFLTPYTPRPLDVPQRDILRTLITESRPTDLINAAEWGALPVTAVARGTAWESDRLAALDELATALGVQVIPDRLGVWRFSPINRTSPTPAWTIDAGPTGVLTKAELTTNRASVYNAVVAASESTTSATLPRRAIAKHTDPASPTRWGGPFGHRPYFYTSPQLRTQADCERAAAAILRTLVLADSVINLEAAPNPALDPDDAVTVLLPDGTSVVHVIDAVTIPLTPDGTLTITTRQRPDPAQENQ
ncbi:DUF5047 domain-containing protein [Actinomadura litoris]|uniref:DUF5047 domain-containing protein n=1 Tax=Actinomadura litoris TaxID=2678616 RepID=UPI001FA71929|nr:DUF5047 domain-containing protein [Actinomadura litoris]